MALIEGVQICIPAERRQARQILNKMKGVLEARKTGRLTRRAFLSQWRSLRKALWLTRDYQELRQRVAERCKGTCERCGHNQMVHVHHLERVAFNPGKALIDANCVGVCLKCHNAEHK